MNKSEKRIRAGVRKIIAGDYHRDVEYPYRIDGAPSKHDRCKHNGYFWEDCSGCITDALVKLLEESET